VGSPSPQPLAASVPSSHGARSSKLGLYLHVPFCGAICNYCNFNRGLFDESLKRRYVDALEREILAGGRGEQADTIFFGGGTPSLLDAPEVARLVSACTSAFGLDPEAEITIEANPETVTAARLDGYRAAGVNRLSYGVQSFNDDELRRLGRLHDAARAREAFELARRAGYDNVSLDLMMWLPQQRLEDWLASVEALVALGPDHASLYLLELYPNAPLREEMARARWSQAPDDAAAEMYLEGMAMLDRAGYEQYEISNVARPGRRSRHNLKYWQDGEWLGFGCGAHSTRRGVRWRNVPSTDDYIARIGAGRDPTVERRGLSSRERVEEALFTGLRLNDGIDIDEVDRRHGVDVWGRYGRELEPYIDAGLVVRQGPRLKLTRQGMLVANSVFTIFV
jgi:oxygen-independent coproporphyrinogen-3 oxidase